MTIDDIRVSVIVTTHGRPQVLGRAIESVLRQTHKNLDLQVVDDNGRGTKLQKETEAVIATYPNVIYHVNLRNLGQAASLNAGIKSASGELVAFLDDDDEYHPEKLAKQIVRLNESNSAGVYCNYQRIFRSKLYFKSNHKLHSDEGDLALAMLLGTNEICGGSTLLLRRSVVLDIGGFDERFRRHVDWSFLISFFRNYQLALCDELLVTINMDDQMWSVNPELQFKTKQLFLTVFEQDVVRHGDAASDIYFKHWSDVYFECLRKGRFGLAFRSMYYAIKLGHFDVLRLLRITASAIKHAHGF